MAEFGADVTSVQPVQSASTVKEGVTSEPSTANIFGSIAGAVGEVMTARRAGRSDATLSDFTNKQLSVIQALEQGASGYTSQYARTMIRKNLMESISAYPALRADLIKANADILGTAGMGTIVTEGTKEEVQRERLVNSMIDNGYIRPGASEQEINTQMNVYQTAQEAKRQLDMTTQNLDLQIKTMGLSEEVAKQRKQAATEQYIYQAAPAQMASFDTKIDAIQNDPSLTAAAKVQAIEALHTSILTESTPYLMDMSDGQRNAIEKLFNERKTLATRIASGEISAQVAETELKGLKAGQELLLMADPTFRQAYAVSNIVDLGKINMVSPGLAQGVLSKVGEMFNENMTAEGEGSKNIFTSNADGQKALDIYLKQLSGSADSTDPAAVAEIGTHLSNIMNGVVDYESLISRDPKAAINLTNWMATPEFLSLRQKYPDSFSNADEATRVIRDQYAQEVWGMVQREFVNAKTNPVMRVDSSSGTTDLALESPAKPVPGAVNYIPTATGVTFQAADPSDKSAANKARQLNKSLAPVINNTIRAIAHLEGNTNYGAVFEEAAPMIFGEQPAGDDNLTTDDYFTPASYEGGQTRGGAGWTEIAMEDGSTVRREGTRAWRNNNPGNIEYSKFAQAQGAIGSDGRFAVFPTYEAGRQAKYSLLFETGSYASKTIEGAINRYAPPTENDSAWYASSVARAVGVPINTPVSQLTESQRQAMLDAMQAVEGWREGTETRS